MLGVAFHNFADAPKIFLSRLFLGGGDLPPPPSILHPMLMLYAELYFCVQEDPPDQGSEHSRTFVGKLVVLAILFFCACGNYWADGKSVLKVKVIMWENVASAQTQCFIIYLPFTIWSSKWSLPLTSPSKLWYTFLTSNLTKHCSAS
jgi:hypothetical protein